MSSSHAPRSLRPLRSARYRLLGGALALNLAGAGMWLVASAWQVIALGAGPAALGLVATGSTLALVAAALLGGVVADRVSRRSVIAWTQAAMAAGVATVAVAGGLGVLAPWHLVAAAVVLGVAGGFFYPAYSALVPEVVDRDDLLAVNGLESMLRPVLMQAVGPAAAAALVGAFAPWTAFAAVAAVHLAAGVCARAVPRDAPPVAEAARGNPVRSTLVDLRAGFAYLLGTPWLRSSLLFFVALVLAVSGPVQVLVPFAVHDRADGGPEAYALVMACYGAGGLVGSLVMSSRRMPRRYLTTMLLVWGGGCLPLAVLGMTDELPVMAAALFCCSLLTSGGGVLWGALLQQRVPAHMLGRVSSLDFFVSLSTAPVSVALAAPAAAAWGYPAVFLAAAVVPPVVALLAIRLGGLARDEAEHPLRSVGAVR